MEDNNEAVKSARDAGKNLLVYFELDEPKNLE